MRQILPKRPAKHAYPRSSAHYRSSRARAAARRTKAHKDRQAGAGLEASVVKASVRSATLVVLSVVVLL